MLESEDSMAAFGGATKGSRMVIVGLGGGGCNAVARMNAGWTEGPVVAAVNTDSQALAACHVPVKVQIGKGITQGLGAGGDPAVGKLAAEDDGDSLRELVSQADIVVIVAALGGGTGTGAAPIMARIAREQGAMTLCFATLPFEFEGELRNQQAEDGLRALRMQADVIITLPNQRLLELVETKPAWRTRSERPTSCWAWAFARCGNCCPRRGSSIWISPTCATSWNTAVARAPSATARARARPRR